MPTRYSDLDSAISGARDFVIRGRTPTSVQMGIIFVCTLIIAVGIGLYAATKLEMVATLFMLFSILGWYVMIQMQRNRDLVMTTEFQNALFASALGINNKFCLIIKRDGNIVYLDRSFQTLFPDFMKLPRRTVDELLEYGRVTPEDSEKIITAIEAGIFDKVIYDIRASDGQFFKIVMSVEPILRPSGFILLRGREFVEKRGQNGSPPPSSGLAPMLSRSTTTLFSYVMDSMDMGIYMTDPAGGVIYANRLLEHWLGYDENEIASGGLTLQDLYHSGGRAESITPDNFEGEISLHKKAGGALPAFINQKVIRDEQGKIIGCTAIISNLPRLGDDVKKKAW